MNIEIVNKQVSEKCGIQERKVELVNKFYWRSIYDHLYSYDPRPINIENVCVLHVERWRLKKAILLYVKKIRNTLASTKFKVDSPKRIVYLERYRSLLGKLWRLRKQKEYIN